jgi:hypothetical protein
MLVIVSSETRAIQVTYKTPLLARRGFICWRRMRRGEKRQNVRDNAKQEAGLSSTL